MRFSQRITFVNEADAYYDPIEGKWVDGELIKTTLPCNVSTLGIDRTNELFGEMDKVITVARLRHPYNGKVDYVFLNEDIDQPDDEKQKYRIRRQSDYRKGVFYLEGISNG
ncbi:hypothetical protein [Oceanobacillus indicireducens]|uniref:Uncharacterized protein n=1 Tax=Oceanobacillus indicireducens TaxID=1004261 RepID=A0A917Y2Z3_9BACI|nr:hypothetical protein [Oceanobacillus indicireducens]GGN64293.1 hypothetical protein GCM10007971_32000 [Oceanobacillus indicireducens]